MLTHDAVVRCADDTLYAGWTTGIDRRDAALNNGKGPKYTKSHGPFTLIYKAEFRNKEWAEQRVEYLKSLSDSDKELFIDKHTNSGKYKGKHVSK